MKSLLGLDVPSLDLQRAVVAPSEIVGTRLGPILDKLARAQSRLLRTADSVSPDQWQTRPSRGGWSAAEVIAPARPATVPDGPTITC